MDKLASR